MWIAQLVTITVIILSSTLNWNSKLLMLQPPKYNQTKTTPVNNDNNTINNEIKIIMIVKSANCKHCPSS